MEEKNDVRPTVLREEGGRSARKGGEPSPHFSSRHTVPTEGIIATIKRRNYNRKNKGRRMCSRGRKTVYSAESLIQTPYHIGGILARISKEEGGEKRYSLGQRRLD